MLCTFALTGSPNKDIRTFFGKGHLLSSRNSSAESQSKASPVKDVTGKTATKSKNPPKFYDTDSDDELDAVDPQKKLAKDSDINFDHKDLPEAILKDLLSDSDDELLCDAMKNCSDSKTNDSISKNAAQSKDEEICDISNNSSISRPSTSKFNENLTSDVQSKLREVWGKKFENHGKSKTQGKTAIKRPLLTKTTSVSPTKKIKTDQMRVDVSNKGISASKAPSKTGNIFQIDEPRINNTVSSPSSSVETDVCKCPVCSRNILMTHINQHLDGCLGIT
jgi:hypothetical protein